MTARVCKALAHPATTMLGHATGRLLLRREGYKIDLEEVLKRRGRARQDDRDQRPAARGSTSTGRTVSQAKAMGIPLVINPDAHSDRRAGALRVRRGRGPPRLAGEGGRVQHAAAEGGDEGVRAAEGGVARS